MRRIFVASLIFLIIFATVIATTELLQISINTNHSLQAPEKSGFHLGVSFCGNTTDQAIVLIDKVKTYTNLFVIQSGPVSVNETAMNQIVEFSLS